MGRASSKREKDHTRYLEYFKPRVLKGEIRQSINAKRFWDRERKELVAIEPGSLQVEDVVVDLYQGEVIADTYRRGALDRIL